jgi:signal transduction histidine kinase
VTDVKPVLDALARTLERIHRERGLSIAVTCPDSLRFRGERQDLEEMVGNLLDNACKWAQARVSLSAAPAAEGAGRSFLGIVVEDDGPGLPADKRAEALKRGRRLDETKPGSGLGLSIVSDTAAMYGGSVALEVAALGGLRVRLVLPAAA